MMNFGNIHEHFEFFTVQLFIFKNFTLIKCTFLMADLPNFSKISIEQFAILKKKNFTVNMETGNAGKHCLL